MAEDRWHSRDLPMLQAIARLEEGDNHRHFGLRELARETGFEVSTVKQSLRRLGGEYVVFNPASGDGDDMLDVRDVRLLPEARRQVEQWPSPEHVLTGLVEALQAAAEEAQDPQQKSGLRKAAGVVAGLTGDLATNLTATVIAKASGLV